MVEAVDPGKSFSKRSKDFITAPYIIIIIIIHYSQTPLWHRELWLNHHLIPEAVQLGVLKSNLSSLPYLTFLAFLRSG